MNIGAVQAASAISQRGTTAIKCSEDACSCDGVAHGAFNFFVGEKTYNYKKTPIGEADAARESRLRVKRKARQRALVYLCAISRALLSGN